MTQVTAQCRVALVIRSSQRAFLETAGRSAKLRASTDKPAVSSAGQVHPWRQYRAGTDQSHVDGVRRFACSWPTHRLQPDRMNIDAPCFRKTVSLFPRKKEADVAGHSSGILEHLRFETKAERSEVIAPEFVTELWATLQSLLPIGL